MAEERVFKRKLYDRMLQWKKERDGKTSERYLIYTKDYRKEQETTLLPVFLTPFLS